jgi:hypothetical protein
MTLNWVNDAVAAENSHKEHLTRRDLVIEVYSCGHRRRLTVTLEKISSLTMRSAIASRSPGVSVAA